MDKQTALAVIGAAVAIGTLSDYIDQRKRTELKARLEKSWMKFAQQYWRDAYVLGFNDCNARNGYTIPRDQYPKFD